MDATQRYKLTVAYRGTHYHGWQQQTATPNWKGSAPEQGQGIPTIEQTLRLAIMQVVGHPLTLCGSSRTDAGVHAKGQVAHFDTSALQIPAMGLMKAVNSRLPADILIRSLEPVPHSFSAISSTLSKRYQYLIWNHALRNVFLHDITWYRRSPLNIPAMQQAANMLIGEHDFASFAKPGHGRESTVRTLLGCQVSARGPRIVVGVEGTGFLWNMVRIIVGTLVEVGHGRYDHQRVKDMLEAKSRLASGPTAPPHGLYLQWIKHKM